MALISEAYRAQNAALHRERADYGAHAATAWGDWVRRVARAHGCASVLDYGCGKATLGAMLAADGFAVQNYDPAMEAFAAPPRPADLVVCNDVLEHIEPDCIDDVLADIARLSRRLAALTVATVPAAKTLPDGRNAHLIVQPLEWWLSRLFVHFRMVYAQRDDSGAASAMVLEPNSVPDPRAGRTADH